MHSSPQSEFIGIPERSANYSRALRQITDDLLLPDNSDRVCAAAEQLYSLYASITGISDSSDLPGDTDETQLGKGTAISPKDAARCVLDFHRTSKFLRGLHAAIIEAQQRFPGTTIEILYAGCGPFAPLAIPLTTRFGADEIKFTLLEIHKRALGAAQQLIETLGLTAFVRDYIECDASSYILASHPKPHIVITEAMQKALQREPQVAIAMNLVPQLCQGGILIPETIAVDACLGKLREEFPVTPVEVTDTYHLPKTSDKHMAGINLGTVFELTVDHCRAQLTRKSKDGLGNEPCFPVVTVEVPKEIAEGLKLMLLTTITTFGSVVLESYESGLTCPEVLHAVGKIRGGERIEFQFMMSNKPGFKYRFV